MGTFAVCGKKMFAEGAAIWCLLRVSQVRAMPIGPRLRSKHRPPALRRWALPAAPPQPPSPRTGTWPPPGGGRPPAQRAAAPAAPRSSPARCGGPSWLRPGAGCCPQAAPCSSPAVCGQGSAVQQPAVCSAAKAHDMIQPTAQATGCASGRQLGARGAHLPAEGPIHILC